jgi:hypothetical protein
MKSIILHSFEVRNALKNDAIQIRRPTKIIYECAINDTKREPKFQDTLMAKWLLKMCKCPFGQPGDWLWVKETFYRHDRFITYKADLLPNRKLNITWKSPIHMSGWESRIALEVEDIRVESVQDINYNGMILEGFTAIERFSKVWDFLYAKKGFGWDNNLPVWVGKFKVVERK